MARILIIDDDDDVRAALAISLQHAGYEVSLSMDGLDALEALRTDLPSAIVLDLMMPYMNGLEMLATLRAREEWARIPVVVITANRGYDEQDLHVQAVLRKPFELEELIAAIGHTAASR